MPQNARRRRPRGSNRRSQYRRAILRDPCVYCGGISNTLDHIQSLADGGENGWENRAPACADCNRRKGDLPVLLFLLGYQFSRQDLTRHRPARWSHPLTHTLGDRLRALLETS